MKYRSHSAEQWKSEEHNSDTLPVVDRRSCLVVMTLRHFSRHALVLMRRDVPISMSTIVVMVSYEIVERRLSNVHRVMVSEDMLGASPFRDHNTANVLLLGNRRTAQPGPLVAGSGGIM